MGGKWVCVCVDTTMLMRGCNRDEYASTRVSSEASSVFCRSLTGSILLQSTSSINLTEIAPACSIRDSSKEVSKIRRAALYCLIFFQPSSN
jgi:hypothetical protein